VGDVPGAGGAGGRHGAVGCSLSCHYLGQVDAVEVHVMGAPRSSTGDNGCKKTARENNGKGEQRR
jgi:hypothetical protein